MNKQTRPVKRNRNPANAGKSLGQKILELRLKDFATIDLTKVHQKFHKPGSMNRRKKA